MKTIPRGDIAVLTVPAFRDNYLWLVHDGKNAVAVDPGDAEAVAQALATHGLTLTAILLTHHHADHSGGAAQLARQWNAPVYGPRHEHIAGVTHMVGQGDRLAFDSPALALLVLDVPGHTVGHVAYLSQTPAAPWVFCGDTLFGGGCGRIFEGTPAQMAASLAKLARLPEDTRVYCAHEYTLSNLRFALEVEPDNAALRQRYADAQQARANGIPTVPSTIGLERETNPFLRCDAPQIRETLLRSGRLGVAAGAIEAFAALREWKNSF